MSKLSISKFALLLILAAGIVPALSQDNVTKVGTTSAKFLNIPVGARATALGGAFAAIANDATAAYWNPGALSHLNQSELYFMHSDYFADINLAYISAAFPLEGFGTVGLSLTSLYMNEMLVTTIDDPEGLTGSTFDAGSFAFGVSYARNLTDKFTLGATVKYISETIAKSKASGMAIDLGTLFTTPFRDIRLGVSVSNFGPKLRIDGDDLLVQKDIDPSIHGNNESVNANLTTDEFDLPLNLRLGLAYDPIKTDNNRFTVAIDALHPNDNSESVNAGAEWALFKERFFLRGGYRNLFIDENESSYTAGFGLQYLSASLKFRLDYAYADQQHLQGIHQFGFSLRY
jgi:opacity protein-like surface antigen